ncbi:MAG TPA: hypothetical protein VMZ26_06950 [Pyrinomonadaceae bacterium]|nr:hypothetical protein [Pyrinomonadaceae bacterium]
MLRRSFFLALTVSIFSVLSFVPANAQQLSEELRPFDFSNDFYKTNGIVTETLFDRKNGADGRSVFDSPEDTGTYSNVRITETFPAYAADGSPIYWNYYASASKESFIPNESGAAAVKAAKTYPLYIFPSAFVRDTDRQAALIPVDSFYFQINPIGIAQVIIVEFSGNISRSGQKVLNMLAQRNGTSIDGTPIIRTSAELGSLVQDGLVTLRGNDNAPYAVAKVIQHPERGGITADAFLVYVKQADGQPLAGESHFVTQFECLKNGGACVSQGR